MQVYNGNSVFSSQTYHNKARIVYREQAQHCLCLSLVHKVLLSPKKWMLSFPHTVHASVQSTARCMSLCDTKALLALDAEKFGWYTSEHPFCTPFQRHIVPNTLPVDLPMQPSPEVASMRALWQSPMLCGPQHRQPCALLS